MSGIFISFEGGEGSGKSTQLARLFNIIKLNNLPCTHTREPGGVPSAESIRALLLNGASDKWDPLAETLLFYAARVEHVNRLIKPALQQKHIVLCDRFADSTAVYQGIGKGLSEQYVRDLHHLTLGSFAPHLTLIFDIDPQIGVRRALSRSGSETRFEGMDMGFHQQVRAGFLSVAREQPARCAVIDASGTPQSIESEVIRVVNERTGLNLKN